jgi:hypothetical protein
VSNEMIPPPGPPGSAEDLNGEAPLPAVTPLPLPPRDMRLTDPPRWQDRLRKALILA